ncbi:MAG TPA: hypothetical protein DDY29_08930 [Rhodobacteraceae bacterium]|jgi:uncharacterized membrane protein YfcA|nr:hypothetical protein [Paracoccaceae bacterium]
MPELADLLPLILMLAAIGAVAGVIAGLLGVGGGIILVPAFLYAFGALGYGGPAIMQVCLATSLATIVVTSIRSVLAHNRKGAVDWAILRGWAPGIAAGAVLGMLTVAGLATQTLQALFGALALTVAAWLGFGRASWRLGPAMPRGPLRVILAPLLGFLSVLMGIGGGSFGVPLMTVYGVPVHRAVATAAGFGAVIAVPAVAGFLLTPAAGAPPGTLGSVNLPAFTLVIAMTLLTTPIGVRLAHATDASRLKRIFALFLAAVALNMLWSAWGG